VTHEIRNPLSAILGGVEIAENCSPGSPEASEAFATIKRSAARILAISDEVLTLSRDESQPELVQREACWLPAVWRALQIDCEALSRAPEVELQWKTPAPSVTLDVDRRRLEVVVHNLVGNALKFTDHGIVEVSCSVTEHELVIRVRDTGIGIADVDQTQVFELFQRGRNPQANARRGTGVGLHTVRQYVRQLGGDVTLTSVHGLGSTFEVRLPVRVPAVRSAPSG
jgi:signal transduction histidine kinase